MTQEATKISVGKKLPLRPCGPHVLVMPDPVEEVSEGGIITGTKEQLSREGVARVKGTIMAIGKGAWIDYGDGNPWAEVGDHVYFKRHVSDRYEDENDIVEGKPQQYFLLTDLDILGIIED